MSGSNTSAETLQAARRFNANGNQEISSEQAEAIENNMFLRSIILELEHAKTISAENVAKLRKVFSSLKNFKCLEKYLCEVTISLGISRNPELVAMAKEFNAILIEKR